jgi:hypothetical protein
MPRRNKKSTAKKPKGSKSGISINIKNVMKQVQNEAPRNQDFIRLGRNPQHNLETGCRTRLQNPAITYASRPLSQFPSLASLAPIQFAPPLSQLKSNSIPVASNSVPIVTPEQDSVNDRIERSRPSVKEIQSTPIIPEYDTRYNDPNEPNILEITPPVERYLVPAGISSVPLSLYDGKEDPIMDESQRIVANQLPNGFMGARERVLEMANAAVSGRGRPKLNPGESGKKKERLQYGPTIPKRFQRGRAPVAAASSD